MMTNDIDKYRKISLLKEPKQKRAKAKVAKVLDSAKQLLVFHGLEKLTTNHIAKDSGVSVGSIYQYFPNKQSIILKIYLDWLAEVKREVMPFKQASLEMDANTLCKSLFKIIYADHTTNTQQQLLEKELTKAMRLFPELGEIEKRHSSEMITLLSEIIGNVLPENSNEKSVQLAIFLYSLDSSIQQFFELGGDQKLAFEWYEKIVMQTLKF